MLDACYLAKRIRELLPELPDGVTPAYIQYMDVIHTLQNGDSDVKVKVFGYKWYVKAAKAGRDKNCQGNGKKGYLSKTTSKEDARITYITLTKKGEQLSEKYDKNYYSRLVEYMDDISDEEADCMILTIDKFYRVMNERRVDIE